MKEQPIITLFQFHRLWGLPNASPFCMKVENYLRMTGLPYENIFINDPRQAPKGKLPYIQFNDALIGDSEFIIDTFIEKFGDPLNNHLTEEQKALGVLLDNVFAERLYWIEVFMRWQDDAGWAKINEAYFKKMPFFPRLFVPKMIRKKMIKTLYLQGTGRHNRDEVVQLGQKTLDALATILSNHHYFLGDKPSRIDATAFAFLANLIWSPLDSPIKHHALHTKNIVDYCERMWKLCYFDWDLPSTV